MGIGKKRKRKICLRGGGVRMRAWVWERRKYER